MRVSTHHLQQLAIFTTLLTGGSVGTMYYLMQKKFSESDYHRLALQKLKACPVAMETLGAPPLKVHNIHLSDRHNHFNQDSAQMKIPVTGSNTGGYLYIYSARDPDTKRWGLEQAVLRVREGQTINLLTPLLPAGTQIQTLEHTKDMDYGH
ncbi:cytochrome c oxidase assembly factor 1 homolog [Echeneis naucrates]|uniref:Cytochrome c oxidase assembly factor 1 homolog n=1 Tax=Echeneis naucrates TaxID=173247 RepID=A0A665UYV7_ECHNA|nr:cytochrome c oxidase assembly factor 1 homolog [Echeneis naucrates]XP_029381096.1 cytochrome c oxidase assembly factor 1 homolog [Echeneis naucrates]XP_029381098.1 cytochrome c oxidase assembly factor 1 homolog [Echeneis naucrates]XP_029381099.1 cytochrome c oxidase assembly factor 1 homolog [Echeneis naucrates]XP_029381100.1 cytochrome c oxidase assembly factor 1 homolog [Echeneis naucrates]